MAVTDSTLRYITGFDAIWPVEHVYNVEYTVDMDESPLLGPLTVFSQAQAAAMTDPIPKKGDPFSLLGDTDLNSVAHTFSFNPVDGKERTQWIAKVIFKPLKPGEPLDTPPPTDPILASPIYWVEWIESTEIFDKPLQLADLLPAVGLAPGDITPPVNSVGEPYDTPLTKNRRRPVLAVEKRYASYQNIIDIGVQYDGSLNSVDFKGKAVGTVRFVGISSGQSRKENDIEFWPAVLRFEFSSEVFRFETLNRGFKYTDDLGANFIETDDDGHKFTRPFLLRLDGTRVPSGQVGDIIRFVEPASSFQDFNSLGV